MLIRPISRFGETLHSGHRRPYQWLRAGPASLRRCRNRRIWPLISLIDMTERPGRVAGKARDAGLESRENYGICASFRLIFINNSLSPAVFEGCLSESRSREEGEAYQSHRSHEPVKVQFSPVEMRGKNRKLFRRFSSGPFMRVWVWCAVRLQDFGGEYSATRVHSRYPLCQRGWRERSSAF